VLPIKLLKASYDAQVSRISLVDNTQLLHVSQMACLVNDWHSCPQTKCSYLAHPFIGFENFVKMLVVIHTFLFVLYFTGNIFIFFKHSFDDFQTIYWRPSVPAITLHTL
jgi:hypothetical protein